MQSGATPIPYRSTQIWKFEIQIPTILSKVGKLKIHFQMTGEGMPPARSDIGQKNTPLGRQPRGGGLHKDIMGIPGGGAAFFKTPSGIYTYAFLSPLFIPSSTRAS